MVSIAAIGDCHLGYRHRFKTERLRDYLMAFNHSIQEIMKLKPDIVLIAGDLLHHPKPDPVSLRSAVEKLMYLADHMQVIITVGNHEIQGHLGTTYTPIYASLHENIHVLTTDNPVVSIRYAEPVNIWGFQYLRSKKAAEETLREISKKAGGGENILCIHQAIEGYLEPHELSLRCLREVENKFDLIVSGHVHKYQKINELTTPAYYIGSTERVSFNEAENPTGFLYFKDVQEPAEYIEVKSSKMRRVQIKGKAENVRELNQKIRNTIQENMDVDMLKVEVNVDLVADLLEVKNGYEEFEDEFKILEVNVNLAGFEEEVELGKMTLGSDLIREYFEKTRSDDRELVEKCVELFDKYCDE